ncbi:pyridoxal 5'-phosphate synthase glutaminase subunit PdxT [Arthrobacter sp. APC 3897]|uniref:pyridoxal 5'-phosphate synthase glutaminase subunit PdxT n=1 Tax=Arthrobacter sp. APC 3897 TaxID=3035204 RepID=UPI0025B376D0|nr:pyridoxal 5'-phosphate synthase glutaminase subunit PdxT [Arthrobacter sp. APC 3897]MDN3482914.1 pyridoxal 5'-phosphate synthase glutaminase subunit PdxT [Arthrobacter sp. APC 3897]
MTNKGSLRVGVLALQGGVREHVAALEAAGAAAVPVRRPAELDGLHGLVLPGGESTTIDKLMRTFGVYEPLQERIRNGFPVYGSCAGMILLADRISDPARSGTGEPQQTLGGLDMDVRRNAFGRQRESFETLLDVKGLEKLPSANTGLSVPPVHAVFIRAPWVEKTGNSVDVLARVPPQGHGHASAEEFVARIVAVRSGNLLATSFHPEVTGESRIHELFIQIIRGEA